ncbi:hypothetical protein GCK32_003778 [Trichostrongylus colubriformis]|uniref:Uncharacterized protein n=1 Tax=Trichostrongylus colubriformis TaxID=6319 RepID=A0AAN8G2L4_TRICO
MSFESPDPQDLEFEFSLANAGCEITVMKHGDFNDDAARKLFPKSSAQYFPTNKYTITERYFSESFWDEERSRLSRIRAVWVANSSKIVRVRSIVENASECRACISEIMSVVKMCDWMLGVCWNGNRSKPPIPLHLYKTRMDELKEKSEAVLKRLQEYPCEGEVVAKAKEAAKTSEDGVRNPKKPRIEEAETLFCFSSPESGKPVHWRSVFLKQVEDFLSTVDKDSSSGELLSEAQSVVMELQLCLEYGGSYGQASVILKKLDEVSSKLKRDMSERIKEIEMERKRRVDRPSHASASQSASTSSTPSEVLLNSSTSSSTSKRKRKIDRNICDSDEKKVSVNSEASDPSDDLISRVKRGQRNRRPTRSFTPGWTPPGSPTGSKPTTATKGTPTGRDTPSVSKPTLLPRKSQTPTLSSPDSGRPSSNESSDTALTAAKRPRLQSDAPQLARVSAVEDPSPAPIPSSSNVDQEPSHSTQSSPATVHPSTSNVITRQTDLERPTSPQPPPLNLTEQGLMAIWNERIALGDVRITLQNMYGADGTPQYYFIPHIIETIDKAIKALDKKDLIVYGMHKAAVDAGCNLLGNVMLSCNPVDPTGQLTSLAITMGINPATLRSILQPYATNAGLNANMLADIHGNVAVMGLREQISGAYAIPTQSIDQIPGFVERDVSGFLL